MSNSNHLALVGTGVALCVAIAVVVHSAWRSATAPPELGIRVKPRHTKPSYVSSTGIEVASMPYGGRAGTSRARSKTGPKPKTSLSDQGVELFDEIGGGSLGRIEPGSELTVLRQEGGWMRVGLPDGRTGYVRSADVARRGSGVTLAGSPPTEPVDTRLGVATPVTLSITAISEDGSTLTLSGNEVFHIASSDAAVVAGWRVGESVTIREQSDAVILVNVDRDEQVQATS